MAISFKDSLQRRGDPNNIDMVQQTPARTIYTADADAWIIDSKYLFYPEYSDTDISIIDRLKNIELSQTQVCLMQESNSQFIPFEMERYYDNFDLQGTTLYIHFVNSENGEADDSPINVQYNSKKIRFGWLVDSRATNIAGNIQFEIVAYGKNKEGEEYVWKTKPCNGLNVLKSLSGSSTIEPDDSWQTTLIAQITSLTNRAEDAARRAEAAAEINGAALTLDKTLSIEGQAADAKAVGDAIARVSFDLDKSLTISGVAADAKAVGDRLAELFGDISEALDAINGAVV